jgi:hypothetical protein
MAAVLYSKRQKRWKACDKSLGLNQNTKELMSTVLGVTIMRGVGDKNG